MVVAVICSSSLICTLVSNFVNDGSTKKILNLVLGAFIVCSLIVPVKNALGDFEVNVSQYQSAETLTSTSDEAYSKEIVNLTKENLEHTLTDILAQNNITINRAEIILSITDNNSIIISQAGIYISKEYTQYADLISNITLQNFGVVPSIITE